MNGAYMIGHNRPYGQMPAQASNGLWGGGGGGGGMGMGMANSSGAAGPNLIPSQQILQYQKQQQHQFMMMQQQQMYMYQMQQQQQQPSADFNKPTKPGWAESRPGRTPCKENWWSHVLQEMTWIDSPRGIDLDVESPSLVAASDDANACTPRQVGGTGYTPPQCGYPGSPGIGTHTPTAPVPLQQQHFMMQPCQQHQQKQMCPPVNRSAEYNGAQKTSGAGQTVGSLWGTTDGTLDNRGNSQANNNSVVLNGSMVDSFQYTSPPQGVLLRTTSPGSGEMEPTDFVAHKTNHVGGADRHGGGEGCREPSLFNVDINKSGAYVGYNRQDSDDEEDEDASDSSDEEDEDSSYSSSSDDEDASGRDMGVSTAFGHSVVDYSVIDSTALPPASSEVSTSEVANYLEAIRRASLPQRAHPLGSPSGAGGAAAAARHRQSTARGYSIPGLSGLLSASDVVGGAMNPEFSTSAVGPRHKARAGKRGSNAGAQPPLPSTAGLKKGKKERTSEASPLPHAPPIAAGEIYPVCGTPATLAHAKKGSSAPPHQKSLPQVPRPAALPELQDDGPLAARNAHGSAGVGASATSPVPTHDPEATMASVAPAPAARAPATTSAKTTGPTAAAAAASAPPHAPVTHTAKEVTLKPLRAAQGKTTIPTLPAVRASTDLVAPRPASVAGTADASAVPTSNATAVKKSESVPSPSTTSGTTPVAGPALTPTSVATTATTTNVPSNSASMPSPMLPAQAPQQRASPAKQSDGTTGKPLPSLPSTAIGAAHVTTASPPPPAPAAKDVPSTATTATGARPTPSTTKKPDATAPVTITARASLSMLAKGDVKPSPPAKREGKPESATATTANPTSGAKAVPVRRVEPLASGEVVLPKVRPSSRSGLSAEVRGRRGSSSGDRTHVSNRKSKPAGEPLIIKSTDSVTKPTSTRGASATHARHPALPPTAPLTTTAVAPTATATTTTAAAVTATAENSTPKTAPGPTQTVAPRKSEADLDAQIAAAKSSPVPLKVKNFSPVPPATDAKSTHPAPRHSTTTTTTSATIAKLAAPKSTAASGPPSAVPAALSPSMPAPAPASVPMSVPASKSSRDNSKTLDKREMDVNSASQISDDVYGGYDFDDAYNYYMNGDSPRGGAQPRPSITMAETFGYDLFTRDPLASSTADGLPRFSTNARNNEMRARGVVEDLLNGQMGTDSRSASAMERRASPELNASGYMYF